jgi:hypothetical protein
LELNLTASQEAKAAGFKSLAEVRGMLGANAKGHPRIGKNVLHSWHKNKPELFRVVIAGCAAIKGENNAN